MRLVLFLVICFVACTSNFIPEINYSPSNDTSVIQTYDISLTSFATLDNEVRESSGLAMAESGHYWTHNDAGNKADVYKVDHSGDIIQTIRINNNSNIDWEDMTADPVGNLYIADTGNNNNDRQNLKVLIIPFESLDKNMVAAKTINVSLSDQNDFPPEDELKSFDVEAITWFDDNLYFFTRDRSKPFIGFTKLYRISTSLGTQVAELVGAYKTDDDKDRGAITGAATSKDGSKVAIVSNRMLWVFKNFSGDQFFSQDIDIFKFDINTEIEAITFEDDCTVILSDEVKNGRGGNLYSLDICR